MRLAVRVPATVANLGPGFDALGMALDLWNEVELDTEAPAEVVVEGEGSGELPADERNLVVRAMASVAQQARDELPSFRLSARNEIPLEIGLGSSAAAVTAGVLLADRLIDIGLGADGALEVAVELEGHADNVAACLRGGVVVAYPTEDGWRAESLGAHAELRPVVLVPEGQRLPTGRARRALPGEVPLEDAAFNAGRAALTLVALTRRPELLRVALDDRLHQAHRLALVPDSRAVFERLRDEGVPVCVAGAGPSLLAFETQELPVPDLGPAWRALRLQVAPRGADVFGEER